MAWLAFFIGVGVGGLLGIIVIGLMVMWSENSRAPTTWSSTSEPLEIYKEFQNQGESDEETGSPAHCWYSGSHRMFRDVLH